MKSIVIYFSHTGENFSVGNVMVGNTAKLAACIAAATGSETWEIREAEPYPTAYDDCIARAKKELEGQERPAFVGTAPDLTDVETIYLGYPNWWGDAPMIVYSFLDSVDIAGKTILPFCTHEGSGLGATARKLAEAYPQAAVGLNGLAIYGHVAQNNDRATTEAVTQWLEPETSI